MRAKTTNASRLTLLTAALVAGVALSEEAAYALQGGEDPALLPVLVDKRFGAGGRHQLSLFFSTSMVTKFVQGTGAYATYDFSFSDLLGLELGGGYFFSSESNIMAEVRQNFPGTEPPLSDLYQLTWLGSLDVVLVPIYGKMSFASEIDPSFDLFLVAGGGVGGVRRQVGLDEVRTYDSKVTPAFNVGIGMRFYFNRLVAVRLEFRDYFYPEPGAGPDIGGLTYNLHFQGGFQFAFGGEE